jgi:hypothetical protein
MPAGYLYTINLLRLITVAGRFDLFRASKMHYKFAETVSVSAKFSASTFVSANFAETRQTESSIMSHIVGCLNWLHDSLAHSLPIPW